MSNTSTPPAPAPATRSATKAVFTHAVDIILNNMNVTSTNVLDNFGLDDIADILALDDAAIEGLTYPDPDRRVTQPHPWQDFAFFNRILYLFTYFTFGRLITVGISIKSGHAKDMEVGKDM
jgi:hypothetical protein